MDLKLVPGYLKSYATATVEDKDHEICYGNYHRVRVYVVLCSLCHGVILISAF
jgi:hypothetical protein